MAKQSIPDKPTDSKSTPPAEKPRKPARVAAARDASMPWSPWLRALVSVLAVLHLAAVFVPPWYLYVATPDKATPALAPGEVPRDAAGREIPRPQWNEQNAPLQQPPLIGALGWFFRHYANLLYINNGYEFFSPNPMAGHVIDYEVFDDAGKSIAKGRLPDLREQWPRLFYHRHMMLVDQILLGDSELARGHVYAADRIMREHGGDSIKITLLVHRLLTPREVLDGRRSDDPALYQPVDGFTHRAGDLPPPEQTSAASEAIPSPDTRIPGVN